MVSCCIRRDVVSFDGGGIFDDVCEMCAVILCCGEEPARLGSVQRELPRLRPLRHVELCFFAGREACGAAHSAHDLSRNYVYLFRDALARGVGRLLVLEDDFQVPRPLEPEEVASISAFLAAEDVDVYGLGNVSLPTLDTLFSQHHRAAFSGLLSTQACFYSAGYMRTVVDFFGERDVPADFRPFDHWPSFFKASAYRYCKPLVVQTFPSTENQRTSWWSTARPDDHVSATAARAGTTMLVGGLRLLNLHEQAQPGWDLIYVATNCLFFPLLLLFVAALAAVILRRVQT